MGEYAVDQMMRDFERTTGIKADWRDFEDTAVRSCWPQCPKCGKPLKTQNAVNDHLRDKHGVVNGK